MAQQAVNKVASRFNTSTVLAAALVAASLSYFSYAVLNLTKEVAEVRQAIPDILQKIDDISLQMPAIVAVKGAIKGILEMPVDATKRLLSAPGAYFDTAEKKPAK